MFDHFMGLLLLGLGLQSPINPNVKGDSTQVEISSRSGTPAKLSKLEFHNTTGNSASGSSLERFHREIEAKRQSALERYKTKREAFEVKLKTIKDERKKETVSNLQTRFSEVNTKRTDRMTDMLTKMTDLTNRIVSKSADLKAAGKDTVSVDAAVISAQSAISTAQDAVVAQAGVQYVITITSQSGLKANVETVRKLLEADIKSVYDKVVVARRAVSSAIRELAKARGEEVPEQVIK